MSTYNPAAGPRGHLLRIAAWSVAGLLLLAPLVAMRFTDEVAWTGSDFLFAAVLMLSVGLPLELAARKQLSAAYRWGAGVALMTAFLLVWAIGAVGNFDGHDEVFGGVFAVGLLGALIARFRPLGMARAMGATAAAHALVAVGAVGAGLVPAPNTAAQLLGINAVYVALWAVSAVLFLRAARGSRAGA